MCDMFFSWLSLVVILVIFLVGFFCGGLMMKINCRSHLPKKIHCKDCVHYNLSDVNDVVYWCSNCVHDNGAEDNFTPRYQNHHRSIPND